MINLVSRNKIITNNGFTFGHGISPGLRFVVIESHSLAAINVYFFNKEKSKKITVKMNFLSLDAVIFHELLCHG
ncbi:hypothetical protein D3C78_1408320 [compost metagenome]